MLKLSARSRSVKNILLRIEPAQLSSLLHRNPLIYSQKNIVHSNRLIESFFLLELSLIIKIYKEKYVSNIYIIF